MADIHCCACALMRALFLVRSFHLSPTQHPPAAAPSALAAHALTVAAMRPARDAAKAAAAATVAATAHAAALAAAAAASESISSSSSKTLAASGSSGGAAEQHAFEQRLRATERDLRSFHRLAQRAAQRLEVRPRAEALPFRLTFFPLAHR
jgi:hypothetical protein